MECIDNSCKDIPGPRPTSKVMNSLIIHLNEKDAGVLRGRFAQVHLKIIKFQVEDLIKGFIFQKQKKEGDAET